MTEPTTAAGRRAFVLGEDIRYDDILAIEAEARAAALDEARAAVEAIPNDEQCFCDADRRPDSDQLYVHKAAVLAAIDALREDADAS